MYNIQQTIMSIKHEKVNMIKNIFTYPHSSISETFLRPGPFGQGGGLFPSAAACLHLPCSLVLWSQDAEPAVFIRIVKRLRSSDVYTSVVRFDDCVKWRTCPVSIFTVLHVWYCAESAQTCLCDQSPLFPMTYMSILVLWANHKSRQARRGVYKQTHVYFSDEMIIQKPGCLVKNGILRGTIFWNVETGRNELTILEEADNNCWHFNDIFVWFRLWLSF